MEEREFHLCREPWIYVMEQDYQVKEVTLIDALVNADKSVSYTHLDVYKRQMKGCFRS